MELTSKVRPVKGDMLKLAIGFDYPSDKSITLDDIDFFVEYFCDATKKVTLQKEDLYVDSTEIPSQYYAYVDTNITGRGKLKMRMNAQLPDAGAPQGIRTEYVEVETDINIY